MLSLDHKDVNWISSKECKVVVPISHRLKIKQGQVLVSKVSNRVFRIASEQGRKQYAIDMQTTKQEREGSWEIKGARIHSLSKKVQTTTSECGSYSIHVILSAIHGKSWHSILKTLPKDKEIQQLRKKMFRS